ncbi:MAG: phytoene desaturase family protein [Phycisphaerales bacterium JB039]
MHASHSSGRVAVVGAGPGGLAAAVLLAGRGLDVTIYERQPVIGGRTSRIQQDGFSFDLGPTFFLMPHVLDEIFSAVGRRLADYVDLRRLDPMYRLVIGQPGGQDITIDATQDVEQMRQRLGSVHGPDGAAFGRFIADNRRKLDRMEPILRRPIRSPLDLVRPDAVRALSSLKLGQSVDDLNGRYFEHPAVRLAVGFQSKYLGMSPYECPSLFTILPFIEYEYGVWHPIGGCSALMRALADVLVELGGRIETDTPVERLRFDGDRIAGVELGGRRDGAFEPCDQLVINADATWAIKKFFPESMRRGDTDAGLDGKRYSCSTYMLYLGVDGAVDLPHHTIRTAPDYRGNLEDIGRAGGAGGSLSEDPSFYICNPSPIDPSLAPPGASSLYILVPTPNTRAPIDWQAERDAMRHRILGRISEVLGVDLAGRIRTEHSVTPADWAAMNINHGATFNLAHSLDQMLHRRPQHKLPYVRNGWLVGGGTHPGSGLPVIFLSAQITAGMMLRSQSPPAPRRRLRPAAPGPASRREPAPVGAMS